MLHPTAPSRVYTASYDRVDGNSSSGLLLNDQEAWDDGYQWIYTDVDTYNTVLTYPINNISSIDAVQLYAHNDNLRPGHVIVILHNVSPNPKMVEIDDSGQVTKKFYSNTSVFWGKAGIFGYTLIPLSTSPGYRYLAFYGEPHSTNEYKPTFQELELRKPDGTNIKCNENVDGIEITQSKAWVYDAGSNEGTIFDGDYTLSPPYLQYDLRNESQADSKAIYFYIDMESSQDVMGGSYWAYVDSQYDFVSGKLYGTNTDPSGAGFGPIPDETNTNWAFTCHLAKNERM
jgi:hypothetical protein